MTKKERGINKRFVEVETYKNYLIKDFDYLVERYRDDRSHHYGQIYNLLQVENYGINYRRTRELMRSRRTAVSVDCGNYCMNIILKDSDVSHVWKDRYVVTKKGGVFDLFNHCWIKRKHFHKMVAGYRKNSKKEFWNLSLSECEEYAHNDAAFEEEMSDFYIWLNQFVVYSELDDFTYFHKEIGNFSFEFSTDNILNRRITINIEGSKTNISLDNIYSFFRELGLQESQEEDE